jgi:hypothetical protein
MNASPAAHLAKAIGRAPANRLVLKHAVIAVISLGLYVLLNRSDVIVETQLGYTVSGIRPRGLALALILGINPWYALLVAVGDALSSALIYHQPLASWGTLVGTPGLAAIYAGAVIILRGPLRIDLGLDHRRDVARGTSLLTVVAAALATVRRRWVLAGRPQHFVEPSR